MEEINNKEINEQKKLQKGSSSGALGSVIFAIIAFAIMYLVAKLTGN